MITAAEIIASRGRPRLFGSLAAMAFVRAHDPRDPRGSVHYSLEGYQPEFPFVAIHEGTMPMMYLDLWSRSETELLVWSHGLATKSSLRFAWAYPVTIATFLPTEQTQHLHPAILSSLQRRHPQVRSLSIMGPDLLADQINSLDHSLHVEWLRDNGFPTSPREWLGYRDYGLAWPSDRSPLEEHVRHELDLHPNDDDLSEILTVLGDFLHAKGESFEASLSERREEFDWGTRHSIFVGSFVLRAMVNLRTTWGDAQRDMGEWLELPESRYLSFKRLGITGLASWLDWHGFDFRGMNLAGLTFELEWLDEANFASACFYDPTRSNVARFEGCQCRRTNFAGADLRSVHFQQNAFLGANFDFADLRGITIDQTNFDGSSFRGARLDADALVALSNSSRDSRSRLDMAKIRAEANIE